MGDLIKHIVFTLLLLTLFSLSATAYVGEAANIKVTLLSQSPDPVEPGQIVTIKLKVENDGIQTSKDAIVRIFPEYPFTMYGGMAEKNIGKLRASSTGADAVIVEFKLKVSEKAVEGEQELEVEVDLGETSALFKDDEILIDIQTHDAVLDITNVVVEPSPLPPGETAEVTVQVKNLADSLLKDIKYRLDFSDDGLPLAPYQSSSERILPQLQTGFQNALVFTIIADPAAEPGLYKIPVNITYNDEKGNAFRVEDVLAVTIGDTPRVTPYIRKSTVNKGKTEGIITIGLANAGTSDVKFVELFFLPSDGYQLVSPTNYFYIGDIDSDDTESEDVTIYVKQRTGILEIPVRLVYLDASNRKFQQQFTLELPLYSHFQLKRFGLVEGNNNTLYLILLILLGAGYYFYQYRWKKGKKLFAGTKTSK